jgi:hypothetical protein
MTTKERDEDGQLVRSVDGIQLVNGITYTDGVPYRRWHVAYRNGETWFGFDTADVIDNVTHVVEFDAIEKVAKGADDDD